MAHTRLHGIAVASAVNKIHDTIAVKRSERLGVLATFRVNAAARWPPVNHVVQERQNVAQAVDTIQKTVNHVTVAQLNSRHKAGRRSTTTKKNVTGKQTAAGHLSEGTSLLSHDCGVWLRWSP